MRTVLSVCLITIFVAAQSVMAQRTDGSGRPGMRITAGDPLPDVNGFDESGKLVNFRELLGGQYAVVVFGCLT